MAIRNLYKGNTLHVEIGNKICGTFERQKISHEAADTHLYNLSFADDQVVISQGEGNLSFMIRKLEEVC